MFGLKKVFLIPLFGTMVLFSLTLTDCDKEDSRKILYYVNPMDPDIKSDKPMKDSMGMDYVPVYEEEKSAGNGKKKILYYVNPMDPGIKSDKPMKDSMGMDYVPVYDEPDRSNADNGMLSSISISESQEKLINVRTAKVEYKQIENIITTVGKINYNEQRKAVVSARFAGRIDKLYVNFTGMRVNKNDPLLLIYSPSLITAGQELLQIYKNEPDDSKSLRVHSRNKLKLYGLTDEQIDSMIKNDEVPVNMPIYSPINGTVIRMDAINGKYVNEGDVLYELSDLDRIWMEADIYEQDISAVKAGSNIEIASMSFPDRVFKSNVAFINSFLDPETRTVKIRAEFENPDGILKPGMYVSAKIKSLSGDKMLVIPAAALLDTGTRQIVYVSRGNGKYVGRQVAVRTRIGDYYPVVSGVKENEDVVVNANFLIDSESQLKGSFDK